MVGAVLFSILMLLHDNRISGNCYKVRLLFAQLGVEYERHELDVIDRSNRPAVLGDLNPTLRIPTLVLDDGRVLAESNAILFYFAEGSDYLPDDRFERAQVLQWMFLSNTATSPSSPRPDSGRTPGSPLASGREDKHRGGVAALEALKGLHNRTFLIGECYSIADMALYAYKHVAANGGFDLEPVSGGPIVADPCGSSARSREIDQ